MKISPKPAIMKALLLLKLSEYKKKMKRVYITGTLTFEMVASSLMLLILVLVILKAR